MFNFLMYYAVYTSASYPSIIISKTMPKKDDQAP